MKQLTEYKKAELYDIAKDLTRERNRLNSQVTSLRTKLREVEQIFDELKEQNKLLQTTVSLTKMLAAQFEELERLKSGDDTEEMLRDMDVAGMMEAV